MAAESAAWIGLVGVAIGAAITAGMDWLRRQWARVDRQEERLIARGEELLECFALIFEWHEDARRVAFTGSVYVPIQRPVFRLAAIVELYYPKLEPHVREVDVAARRYRDALVAIAGNKARGLPMTQELNDALARQHDTLLPIVGRALTAARAAVQTRTR